VFYNLDETELENVRDKMLWCKVEEGEVVYQEGSETHCFFIVAKGELEETEGGQFKKRIKQMDGRFAIK
jgi:CRP-like cAMP-binding protein